MQRRKVGKLARSNHHTASMLANITGQAFEFESHLPDFPNRITIAASTGKQVAQRLLLLQRFLQRHSRRAGNHLRQAISQTVGFALNPCNVTHHRLGSHGTESDDLAHCFSAIFVGHVLNDTVTLVHTKVDIKVRHGHPIRVKKALEQQVVFDRVQIGNFQCISDQ